MICTLFPIFASAQEPYAVMIDGNTAIEFRYDNNRASYPDAMDIGPFSTAGERPWEGMTSSIYSVLFDESFANYTSLTSTAYWFHGCTSLETIIGINYLNTSNVTDMAHMFAGCGSLLSLDVSSLNTENVSNMAYAFSGLINLESLNLGHLNTSNVTDMMGLFSGCSKLTSLDVSSFNTEKVTNMRNMFAGLPVTSLDLSSFNTSSVTDMGWMFSGCMQLTTILVGRGWVVSTYTSGEAMFLSCEKLVGQNGTTYDFNFTDQTYAHVDGGVSNPGYLSGEAGPSDQEEAQYWMELESTLQYADDLYGRARDNSNVEQWMLEELSEFMNRGSDMLDAHEADEQEVRHMIEEINYICWEIEEAMNREPQERVAKPDFNFNRNHLTLSSSTPGANFYYALGEMGGEYVPPTTDYTSELELDHNCTIYAIAWKDGMQDSEVSSFDYDYEGWRDIDNIISMLSYELSEIPVTSANENDVNSIKTELDYTSQLASERMTPIDEMRMRLETIAAEIDRLRSQPTGEAEPYAVLSNNNTVLTFYYDNQKSARSGMDVGPFSESIENFDYNTMNYYTEIWGTDSRNIERVVFEPSFANCLTITSTAEWFCGFSNLTTIEGIENLNTSNVTTMEGMFSDCQKISSFNLNSFNTSNVTDMRFMFDRCYALTSLNISSFNTMNVTEMDGMFERCTNLPTIDLSNFNTTNVTRMGFMFNECSSLTTIYVGDLWSTSNVTNSDIMFSGCERLVGGRGTQWSQDHINAEYAHIDGGVDNPGYLTDKGESEAWFDGLTAWVYGDATLDDAFAEVGRESAVQTIAAIVWEGTGALTAEQMQGITNPNLLVYVTEASKAPAGVQNVIVNGTAAQIVLTDASGNNNFFCPEPFTAQSISYTRNFSQTTEIGVSRGWETIALPFTVQSITHESHGVLEPFGINNGYPFWLRQLGSDGLARATVLEANVPFLICMPNNSVYPSVYNQVGNVTFSSSNVTVPETHPLEMFGANVILTPAFQNQAAGSDIFTLNVGEAQGSYPEGSVFISNYRSVRPFQCYARHSNQARGTDDIQFIPLTSIGGGDDTTAIMEIIQPAANGTGDWYSLDGRKLSSKPTQKGIYIQNGKKIVIK